MDIIKHYVSYAVIVAIFWTAVMLIPKCSRVAVPPDYYDIDGLEPYRSYRLDESVTLRQLDIGDGICYQLGASSDRHTYFGWVAGVPGDLVSIAGGHLHVNGQKMLKSTPTGLPAMPPLRVPENHFFVLASQHMNDSLANGPLPVIALRGRIGELP